MSNLVLESVERKCVFKYYHILVVERLGLFEAVFPIFNVKLNLLLKHSAMTKLFSISNRFVNGSTQICSVYVVEGLSAHNRTLYVSRSLVTSVIFVLP